MQGNVLTDYRCKFLVLDDHRVFAEALGLALATEPTFECLGVGCSLENGLELAVAQEPDVLIVDYELIDGHGIDAVPRLRAEGVCGHILMLCARPSAALQVAALAGGASAFFGKDATLSEIRECMTGLVDGQTWNQSVMPQDPMAAVLTPRQREVLTLMGRGYDPARIAGELYLSIHTTRGHVKAVLRALGASTQLEAVTIAYRLGQLVPPRYEKPTEPDVNGSGDRCPASRAPAARS